MPALHDRQKDHPPRTPTLRNINISASVKDNIRTTMYYATHEDVSCLDVVSVVGSACSIVTIVDVQGSENGNVGSEAQRELPLI